jgi:hypothetical protein
MAQPETSASKGDKMGNKFAQRIAAAILSCTWFKLKVQTRTISCSVTHLMLMCPLILVVLNNKTNVRRMLTWYKQIKIFYSVQFQIESMIHQIEKCMIFNVKIRVGKIIFDPKNLSDLSGFEFDLIQFFRK